MKSGMKDYPTSLSTPINRTAKTVTSKGFVYVPAKTLNQELWDSPPPLEPCPKEVRKYIHSRQNRIQIIGYLGKHPNKGHKLLGRCDCGKYERRRLDMWKKWRAFDDCCQRCRHTEYLKNHHKTNDDREHVSTQQRIEHNKKKKLAR